MTNAELGRWGELQAAGFLEEKGYEVLARNLRTPYGEIDLVMRSPEPGREIVFVEVKTRVSNAFGMPESAVTPRKQAHLLASAQAILQYHPEWGDGWRVDVIAIRLLQGQKDPEILHFENAVL